MVSVLSSNLHFAPSGVDANDPNTRPRQPDITRPGKYEDKALDLINRILVRERCKHLL
jgi:hypothetical protein